MDFKALILWGIYIATIGILWLLNAKKDERYRQIYNISGVIIIFGILIFFFDKLRSLFTENIKTWEYIANWDFVTKIERHLEILLVLLLTILIFIPVKPLLQLLGKKFPLFLVYYPKNEKKIYFRNDFTFARLAIKVSLIAVSLLTAFYIYKFYQGLTIILYYLLLVLVLFFELYWFVNGKTAPLETSSIEDNDDVETIIPRNDENFEKVYNFFVKHKDLIDNNKISKITKIRRSQQKNIETPNIVDKEGDLIIDTANYSLLKNEMKTKIANIVLNGGNVLILGPFWNIVLKNDNEFLKNHYYEELNKYFQSLLNGVNRFNNMFEIQTYSSRFSNERLLKPIVITSAYDILHNNRFINDNIDWFKKLDLVIFENVLEKIVLSRTAQSSLSIILKAVNNKVKFWFVASRSLGLEEGIRTQFMRKGNIPEESFSASSEQLSYFMALKNEGRAMQTIVRNLAEQDYMGNETLVMYESYLLGQDNFQWVTYHEQADDDYLEELKKSPSLEKVSHISNEFFTSVQLIKNQKNPFFVFADTKYNLSNIVYKLRLKDNNKAFYSISSFPYLLRDYMLDNLKYFFEHPLFPIAPQINQSNAKNKLIILFETLKKHTLTKQEILSIFDERDVNDVIEFLHQKFVEEFGFDKLRDLIQIYEEKDTFFQWIPIKKYHIKSNSDLTLNPSYAYYDIKDGIVNDANSFGKIQKGLALQHFFSKPFHIYHNKTFKLSYIDLVNDTIVLEHEQEKLKDKWIASRTKNIITINKIGELPHVRKQNGMAFRIGLVDTDFEIKTTGRYDFIDDKTFDYVEALELDIDYFEKFFNINDDTTYDEILTRKYKGNKALYYSVSADKLFKESKLVTQNQKDLVTKVSYSFAFILKEALLSFFPDSAEYIHVVSLNQSEEELDEYKILPQVIDKSNQSSEDLLVKIMIFEDSNLELGILRAIKDRLEKVILLYLDDFLSWHINKFENKDTTDDNPANIFADINVEGGHIIKGVGVNNEFDDIQPFLKCVNKEYPAFFDIINTKKFIKQIIGNNEISNNRTKYGNPEDVDSIIDDQNDDLPHYCDFCGREYKLEEMDVIQEDGRERCPVCSENAVDEKEDILSMHQNEVKQFFDYFKLEMPKNEEIIINYLNTKDINKHLGRNFIPTRFHDLRALGFATIKDSKYYIEIENMSPLKRTILTTIHEMVHIWQFNHLDYQKMKRDFDLYLIEGHTTWSEIFYAKHIAKWEEDWENIIAPETRKDEYGDGYRVIKKLLKEFRMDNPFEFLLKYYGK